MTRRVYFLAFIVLMVITFGLLIFYWKLGGLDGFIADFRSKFNVLFGCGRVDLINNIEGSTFSMDEEKFLKEVDAMGIWSGIDLDNRSSSNTIQRFRPCNIKVIFTDYIYSDLRVHRYSNDKYIGSTKVDEEDRNLLVYVGVGSEFLTGSLTAVNVAVDYIIMSDLHTRIFNSSGAVSGFQRVTEGSIFTISNF